MTEASTEKASVRALPSPIEMTMPLVQALGRRRSGREFSPESLDASILSALLWACAGNNLPDGHRTVPSARDCREVEAYVIDATGAWRYDPAANTLTMGAAGDLRGATTSGQDFVKTAPATIVFVHDAAKSEGVLSGDTGRLCVCVDAGCMVEAAQLACAAMGLVSVPRAWFDPKTLAKAMGLSETQTPIMALTVGFPASMK